MQKLLKEMNIWLNLFLSLQSGCFCGLADGCFPVGCFVLQEHSAIPETLAIPKNFGADTYRLDCVEDPSVKLVKNSHEPMGRTAQTEVVILKM